MKVLRGKTDIYLKNGYKIIKTEGTTVISQTFLAHALLNTIPRSVTSAENALLHDSLAH